VDFDGKTTTSEIVSLRFLGDKISVGELFPNPTSLSNSINVEVVVPNTTTLKTRIYNNLGMVVKINESWMEKGSNIFQVHDSFLEKGIYFVRFEIDDSILLRRIVVQ